MSIRDRVVEIIKKNFFVGREYNLQDGQSFLETRSIDSIGMIQLIVLIEEIFSIKIDENEFLPENLDSINAIVGFLERKVLEN